MNNLEGLIDLDVDFYRNHHGDLTRFNDQDLSRHYYKYGYFEGRRCHPRSRREDLAADLDGLKTLEIGPFTKPLFNHSNVKYADVLSKSELVERAEKLGHPTDRVPFIDFVTRSGRLDGIDEKFELVFSSHNIEHQPDLIGHLIQVGMLLNDGGTFAMLVPDRRYCFDALMPNSRISELIMAHRESRTRHTIGSVIENRAMNTHNDTKRHWQDDPTRIYQPISASRVAAAIAEFERSNGGYIDVHAWRFEPLAFADIIRTLIDLKYIPFRTVSCRGPVKNRNEFAVELRL